VLKWIFDRLDGKAEAVETPIGRVPARASLDTSGLTLTDAQLSLLLTVDPGIWTKEAALIPAFYDQFGETLPKGLWEEYEALVSRLQSAATPERVVAAE